MFFCGCVCSSAGDRATCSDARFEGSAAGKQITDLAISPNRLSRKRMPQVEPGLFAVDMTGKRRQPAGINRDFFKYLFYGYSKASACEQENCIFSVRFFALSARTHSSIKRMLRQRDKLISFPTPPGMLSRRSWFCSICKPCYSPAQARLPELPYSRRLLFYLVVFSFMTTRHRVQFLPVWPRIVFFDSGCCPNVGDKQADHCSSSSRIRAARPGRCRRKL